MTVRIGVVGNCQARGFSAAISAAIPRSEVVTISTTRVRSSTEDVRLAWRDSLSKCDVVFSQPKDERFGILAADRLENDLRIPLVVYPLIIFSGFHPDSHYACQNDQHFDRPTPYQSAIIAAAFYENLSESAALALFNSYTYASLGYFDTYDRDAAILTQDFLELGYRLDSFLKPGVAFMHSINHPGIDIRSVALQALVKANLAIENPDAAVFDELGVHFSWPIYPEIGERLGVEGGMTFKLTKDDRCGLPDFIQRSYAVYETLNQPVISESIDRARAFIRSEVVRPVSPARMPLAARSVQHDIS
jgi:hypothetical protein